jgi:hypothetical protein
VPHRGVVRCLRPEGNGVSSGEGGMGEPGPQTEISSVAPARKVAIWSRRKKERRPRCDNEDPPREQSEHLLKSLVAYSLIISHVNIDAMFVSGE